MRSEAVRPLTSNPLSLRYIKNRNLILVVVVSQNILVSCCAGVPLVLELLIDFCAPGIKTLMVSLGHVCVFPTDGYVEISLPNDLLTSNSSSLLGFIGVVAGRDETLLASPRSTRSVLVGVGSKGEANGKKE